MPNFQNNFATNLTSNVNASDTTSPLNSIPTIDAPFYLAFDATNINSHYEVVYVTSKTATNVNHAALAYDHDTSEEVRQVLPAVHMNTMQNFPAGFLINGKIVPSVASDNLTVALKTLAGTDPSETDPVYCRIGDTVRSITSALSITKNAATNWLNAGSAELATKEIDYFVYLGWNAANSNIIFGFSRLPYGAVQSDFNTVDVTNEKAILTVGYTGWASTDVFENIGRFAATLSAGAGYTWSVPTFTASNLIQRPIYETRWLDAVATATPSSGAFTTQAATWRYKLSERKASGRMTQTITTNGTAAGSISFVLPFSSAVIVPGVATETNNTGKLLAFYTTSGTSIRLNNYDNTYSGGNGYVHIGAVTYEI